MKSVKNTIAGLVAGAGIIGSFFLNPYISNAGDNKGRVEVSARIAPYLYANILSQESVLNITQDDISRGYVEVVAGTVMEVKTNTKGYLLILERASPEPVFEEITVRDGTNETILSNSGGTIFYDTSNKINTLERKSLDYMFKLSPGTSPGQYQWPLAVSTILE